MTAHGIDLDSAAIHEFCGKWKIAELSVFGSILREDFRPDSDVDFLVVFEPDSEPDYGEILQMERQLGNLLGRTAQIVERLSLEKSPNYIRRRHILSTARRLNAQG